MGYGHFLIFAAAAAVGAGLGVVVDFDIRDTEIGGHLAGFAVAVPVAVYLLIVWLLHIRPQAHGAVLFAYPGIVVLILLTPLGPAPVHVTAGLLAVLVLITRLRGRIDPERKQSAD
ncbi:low temperature requirement protein A [Actinoplanes sp. NPDC049265]|uniref:low temperature requirement protein A n=1 Tax=Actinoplanes sp. NPDC049265 TaxID=3363902 RepID=UPI00372103A8